MTKHNKRFENKVLCNKKVKILVMGERFLRIFWTINLIFCEDEWKEMVNGILTVWKYIGSKHTQVNMAETTLILHCLKMNKYHTSMLPHIVWQYIKSKQTIYKTTIEI